MFNVLLKSLGVIALLALLGLGLLFVQGQRFESRAVPFAQQLLHDFAENWELGPIATRTTETFAAPARSPRGQMALRMLKHLGPLSAPPEFELVAYRLNLRQQSGTLVGSAQFAAGEGQVQINLVEINGTFKVTGIHIDSPVLE